MSICLHMDANTILEIHDGPQIHYGTGTYVEIINGGKLIIGQGECSVGLIIMCAKMIAIGMECALGEIFQYGIGMVLML